ncbi:preprotein translocase subunit SecE [Collinsella intestinalis]|uniref:preprotein translocase subunit SecE n=1 Tax=Collinsella intestinalis TaxID=147207 RepID=UPI00195A3D9A|nr:preprotein translocase subunit SecE [Collinsella intestinalis]MBM6683865.1 preprotein translocase subunit SecE [Collinsella intestinalis]
MANKKTKKGDTAAAAPSKADAKKAESPKQTAKGKQAKQAAKAKQSKAQAKGKNGKAAKPGIFTRIKKYFSAVRSEMKRVTWPTKEELINYSVAVCISLVVVGIVIAVLDFGISEGLVLFSGLRG